MGRPFVALLTLVGLVAVSCSSGSGADMNVAHPGAEWARADPESAGFDPEVLDDIAADAEYGGANCLVVARHGRIVADWYWNGMDATSAQEVYSVTKSVTSTLVGLAEADGLLDVDDRAARFLPPWEGTASADVTIEDLLGNDSGRHWAVTTDVQALMAAADRTQHAVGLGQDEPPGAVWVYNNSAVQTLDAVLRSATGVASADYARAELFEPLGMHNSELTRDASGGTNLYYGMQSTCEDLARLGELFLRRGRWSEEEILPFEWVRAATGRPSQGINGAYGYLWWLNRTGRVTSPTEPTGRDDPAPVGQLAPGAPEDMFWALGAGGQVVQVDPGSDTVVVRLGPPNPQLTYPAPSAARVVTDALVDP